MKKTHINNYSNCIYWTNFLHNFSRDSFGYTTPPPTQQDMDSNKAGALQQPGGLLRALKAKMETQTIIQI